MYTATLITASNSKALTSSLAQSFADQWGGSQLRWLSFGEAVEFDLETYPDDQWSTWNDCQSLGIDLCLQPAANRRKSLLIADMDSTMIEQECIDELADVAGVGVEVREVTARAMNGELDFEEAVRARLRLLAGLSASAIETVLSNRITLTSGAAELVATMRSAGAYTALVSGGFTQFTSAVGKALGFDEHRANVLSVDGGELTGSVEGAILGQQAKVDCLDELKKRLNLNDHDIIAVGDGANDLGMLQRAGAGVALHAKAAVAAKCDLRINFGDLTALLFLQGYRRSEFAQAAPKWPPL